MNAKVEIVVTEATISADGKIRLTYVTQIATDTFEGVISGGETWVVDSDVLALGASLLESARDATMRDLGLIRADIAEEPLDDLDEDPL